LPALPRVIPENFLVAEEFIALARKIFRNKEI